MKVLAIVLLFAAFIAISYAIPAGLGWGGYGYGAKVVVPSYSIYKSYAAPAYGYGYPAYGYGGYGYRGYGGYGGWGKGW